MAHVAGDRAAQNLAQHEGEFGARHRLGAKIIVLRGMVLGAVAQDLSSNRCNICNGDVADPLLSSKHRQCTACWRRHVQHSFHEHVGVQMRLGSATGRDVALDQREPGEFRVGAVIVGKDALIDNVLHPCLLGSVIGVMVAVMAVSSGRSSAKAKRVGSGGSVGKQSQSVTQSGPAQSAQSPSAVQSASPARPGTPAAAAAKPASAWTGMLGGALLGLGLGALLSNMGVGASLASMISTMLMVRLLVMAGLFI